jgi:hypothetical protein
MVCTRLSTTQGSDVISAFGIDHGETVSKLSQQRKMGAASGAGAGLVAGSVAGGALASHVHGTRQGKILRAGFQHGPEAAKTAASTGKLAHAGKLGVIAGGTALGTAGLGALGGAAFARKKRPVS